MIIMWRHRQDLIFALELQARSFDNNWGAYFFVLEQIWFTQDSYTHFHFIRNNGLNFGPLEKQTVRFYFLTKICKKKGLIFAKLWKNEEDLGKIKKPVKFWLFCFLYFPNTVCNISLSPPPNFLLEIRVIIKIEYNPCYPRICETFKQEWGMKI